MQTGKSNRKIRNLLLVPSLQPRYGFYYFFFFAAVATLVNQMLIVRALRDVSVRLLSETNVDAAQLVAIIDVPVRAILLRTVW